MKGKQWGVYGGGGKGETAEGDGGFRQSFFEVPVARGTADLAQ